MTDDLATERTIHVGPCKCGGYGQCFDEEAEKELGTCHVPLSDIGEFWRSREHSNGR